mgnify:CR=1 FL=1
MRPRRKLATPGTTTRNLWGADCRELGAGQFGEVSRGQPGRQAALAGGDGDGGQVGHGGVDKRCKLVFGAQRRDAADDVAGGPLRFGGIGHLCALPPQRLRRSFQRQVPGYRTVGKTGTAERIDPSCHCYRGYTASYVTVGPVEDPRILTYVVINNPSKGSQQGSGIALPVGRQIMSVALPQFGVPPSRTKAPKKPLEYTP